MINIRDLFIISDWESNTEFSIRDMDNNHIYSGCYHNMPESIRKMNVHHFSKNANNIAEITAMAIPTRKVWNNKRLGNIFRKMMQRCYNENNPNYIYYGAKGIKVYSDWIDSHFLFEKWALENGYNDSLTIDRIDPNKDYCPENCRWISRKDNAKYKSTTRLITVDGECHTGNDWARVLNIGANTINTYIRIHGVDDMVEFIKRYKNNPELAKKKKSNESLFDLYMS